MAKRGKPKPEDSYQKGVKWIAQMDTTHDSTITALKFSPAVCLLSHLTGKSTVNVAEDVIHVRKTGG